MIDRITSWVLNAVRYFSVDDQELTGLELMGKVTDKTNEVVDEVNTLNTSVTALQASKVDIIDLENNRHLDSKGNFTGTLDGYPIVAADPGISSVVAGQSSQLAGMTEFAVLNINIKGDGIADDTTAVQNFINNTTSAILDFGDKTYLISRPIEVHRAVILRGTGAKFKAKDQAGFLEYTRDNNLGGIGMLRLMTEDIIVDGIEFDGNKSNNFIVYTNPANGQSANYYYMGGGRASTVAGVNAYGYSGIDIMSSNIEVMNCTIHDLSWGGCGVSGVEGAEISHIRIHDNTFYTMPDDHIPMINCRDVKVYNNKFKGIIHDGTHVYYNAQGIRIHDNEYSRDPNLEIEYMPGDLEAQNFVAIPINHNNHVSVCKDVIIRDNKISGSLSAGVKFEKNAQNVFVVGNTIDGPNIAIYGQSNLLKDNIVIAENAIRNVQSAFNFSFQYPQDDTNITNMTMLISGNEIENVSANFIYFGFLYDFTSYIGKAVVNITNNVIKNTALGFIPYGVDFTYTNQSQVAKPTNFYITWNNNLNMACQYLSSKNSYMNEYVPFEGSSYFDNILVTKSGGSLGVRQTAVGHERDWLWQADSNNFDLNLWINGTKSTPISINPDNNTMTINQQPIFNFGGTVPSIRYYPQNSAPVPAQGMIYYDKTANCFKKCVDGSTWVNAGI